MNTTYDDLEGALWISGLTKSASLGGATVRKCLEHFGGISGMAQAGKKELIEVIGGPPDKIQRVIGFYRNPANRSRAAEDCRKYQKIHGGVGIHAVAVTEKGYPQKLKEISSAPAILYYCSEQNIGRINQGYSVAVVGTRTPTPYGNAVTDMLISGFAGMEIHIVSGLARGIDSLAHESALRYGLYTVAVLGCGLDIVYPPENEPLMRRIMQHGATLSECPPGTMPARSCFPARNRIISGISSCVAVTEASAKSGTMITAGFAGDQGRDVYAVPGSVFSPHSTGTNQLIRDGAGVLTSAEDLLANLADCRVQYLNTILNGIYDSSDVKSNNREVVDLIRSGYRNVLTNMEMSLEEIAAALSQPIETVSEILSLEELAGEVICRNGRFILTEPFKSSIK
jgi:DNA processing protein